MDHLLNFVNLLHIRNCSNPEIFVIYDKKAEQEEHNFLASLSPDDRFLYNQVKRDFTNERWRRRELHDLDCEYDDEDQRKFEESGGVWWREFAPHTPLDDFEALPLEWKRTLLKRKRSLGGTEGFILTA